MLELFKRMWSGWNVGVRRFMAAQNATLMGVAWLLGIGPVALVLRLMQRDMLDRKLGAPDARSHWRARDGKPLDMQGASRRY